VLVDLNTIEEVTDATGAWRPGDAWLAGGTWLFSEPQPHLTRLRDLTTLGWPPLTVTPDGLEIAATCTIAELYAFTVPPGWNGALFRQCCEAFLASFKIWNVATVGGNLCAALPAGPMISLTAALDGRCTIETSDGGQRQVPVIDFVTGAGTTVLAPGEYLRSVVLPANALTRRTAFRQGSLYRLGRSAALVIGHTDPDGVVLTVTASTARPVRLRYGGPADLDAAIPEYYDDVHGLPEWRRHLTLRYAAEIDTELA
jgi:CO/xanthine dehydrogenase FAD-binding subunit